MRKHYLLITALILSLVFGGYTFFNQQNQKHDADERFIYCIDKAEACFRIDYTKLDENTKNYYFIEAASNLKGAMTILPFTSYATVENKDKYFENAISRLYLCMTVESTPTSTNRWKCVTEKEHSISELLHYISQNPTDKKNWDSLSKITDEIGY